MAALAELAGQRFELVGLATGDSDGGAGGVAGRGRWNRRYRR